MQQPQPWARRRIWSIRRGPRIAECYTLAATKNLVMVPFFISDGLHSFEDIPVMTRGIEVVRMLIRGATSTVEHRYAVPARQRRVHQVRPDEAGAAQEQDPQRCRRLRDATRRQQCTGERGRANLQDLASGAHVAKLSTAVAAGMNGVTDSPRKPKCLSPVGSDDTAGGGGRGGPCKGYTVGLAHPWPGSAFPSANTRGPGLSRILHSVTGRR